MTATYGDANTPARLAAAPRSLQQPRIEELLVVALEYFRSGLCDESERIYREILAEEENHFLCLHHLGLIAHKRGDFAAAARLIGRAVAVKPDYVEAFSNLSAIYRAMGDAEQALAAAHRAITLDPSCAQAHSNLGNALEDQGRLDDALAAYRLAASLNPGFVEAHANAANLLRKLRRPDEAIAVCEQIIARRPDAPEAYFGLGNILREIRQPGRAIEAYQRALALRPAFAEVYANLGNVLQSEGALTEAVAAYREAIELRPDLAEAHNNMGAALEGLGRLGEAIASYRAAVALDPDLLATKVWLHHKRRQICEWEGIDAEETELRALTIEAREPTDPFAALSMATSPAEQLRICEKFAGKFAAPDKRFVHKPENFSGQRRLRIGYLSTDFGRHATALLSVELFELCDKSKFEITAYSHGPDDHSAMAARLRAAFDHFVDLCDLSDAEAAERIKADRIDILVELKGYTNKARTGISALKPAPVQVNFLGFPATMGADFIDYIIADPFVLPLDQQAAFKEKIAHLPFCYQPNDSRRLISEATPTRTACGLPEHGLVFCSFNNTYKITPAFFDIWMRLLDKIPGSALWLLDANELVKDNLRKEAARRGVDPSRLVFAPKIDVPGHLARHRLADLFLDTLPYNAHTTASDALWAGLPVLTCAGETFAGRVAGSLLNAVGLPEFVTFSPADYEAAALHFAQQPALLQEKRRKLLGNLGTAPLFDTKRYARCFEAALTEMWEIFANGGEPRSFAIRAEEGAACAESALPAPLRRVQYHACPLYESVEIPLFLGADCSKHALYQARLPKVMNWRECRSCGHVFTEGYFDPEAAAVLFAKTHPNQTVGYDMEQQRPLSARMVERVARHAPRGAWLDVGFGNGSLLFTAEEWGYAPVGLDLREENVRALNVLGYEAHCLSIEDLPRSERFSVISMADVLEHLPFPKTGLAAARQLLRPGGVLFLSMPNMDSMVWRLLHANKINPYWGEIEHYHNFTRKRLFALLEEHGFAPAEYGVSERYRVCMEVIAAKRG